MYNPSDYLKIRESIILGWLVFPDVKFSAEKTDCFEALDGNR